MMTETEVINLLMLVAARRISPGEKTLLLTAAGSATAVIENRGDLRSVLPGATAAMTAALADTDGLRRKAIAELDFAVRENLDIIPVTAAHYPQRLKGCHDAPPVLFVKGEAVLNPPHVVSIVGTRRSTAYGHDMVHRLVSGLAAACPDTLIVSGLAYGIDINAHRAALESGLPTVAVLAHGLDRLYPSAHRDTARQMLTHGGLITENMTGTVPDRLHFLSRNRIVAGLCDAVIVVESAHHGGALATARLAAGYNRTVAAVPGRATDEYSEGCNNLIRDRRALSITSADDLLQALGWQNEAQKANLRRAGVERTLFPELTDDEQALVNLLDKHGDTHINDIASATGRGVGLLAETLFSLEMKGVVRPLAGSLYHLVK